MSGAAYDGRVTPGGPPQTREAGCLRITKLAVDPQMSNNCYLLECSDDGTRVLVDAAAEPERLLALVGDRPLSAVVTTHQHWDHHRALAEVVGATGAQTIAGAPDADAITEQTGVSVDRRVGAGDTVALGRCTLEVVPVAGHTPGSVCLYVEADDGSRHLFTGDSLFPGGVGATFGDPDAFRQLLADVTTKIFDRFPDDVAFYPGHGDDGRLGDERRSLPEWEARGW